MASNSAEKKSTPKAARVAIIGAGLAGLAAADELINTHGFANVDVFEAQDYAGGRVRTVTVGQ